MALNGDETRPKSETVGVVVIHGVGEAEPGWITDHLMPRLREHCQNLAQGLEFADHNEVYRLADKGRSRPGLTFPAHVHRARSSSGRSVAFMELFWADLSRIGTGTLANWLAMMKLSYEAPQVLGDCFLGTTRSKIANAIGSLVNAANWILRWPITGLNTAALVCALTLLLRQRFIEIGSLQPFLTIELPIVLAGLLALLAIGAVFFARWRVHKDIALTDIGMSTAAFSLLLAFGIIAARAVIVPEAMANPAIYLMGAGTAIFGFWLIWNYAILTAIVLLAALAIGQAFSGKTEGSVPLARPAAAIGLCIIQGVLWKILISLLWIFIFVTLDFNDRTVAACATDPYHACSYLAGIQKDLTGIVVFNLLMVGVLALAFWSIAGARAILRLIARRRTEAAEIYMPRIVVSPLVVFVMLAGTLFNLIIFYWRSIIPVDFYQQVDVTLVPVADVIRILVGGGSALTIAFYLFRALQHASRGILHIVRDLVDHQYSPRFTFSRSFLPATNDQRGDHPRRARIEARLDVLMQELVAKEKFDRLVFVAHSQGTVILHDYLSTNRDELSIRDAKAIDVVTLGSPLSYLYQYYFAKYAAISMGREALNPRLSSWINMWRIDDPIGNRITMRAGDFIRNVPLKPGGHVDYWKDETVCRTILDLIDPKPPAPFAQQAVVAKADAALPG